MSGDAGRPAVLRGLLLVTGRELAVRVRGTAFRVSTLILLAVTVAGIAIPSALLGRPQRYTVTVTAQAPPAVAAAVRADAQAAGLPVTVVPVPGRAAAVSSVERGSASAAVAAGGEIIWKAAPISALEPVLQAAVRQAVVSQRAASLRLSPAATARLLAPVQAPVTQLHPVGQSTARVIIAEAGMILLYIAIAVYGGYVLTGVVEEKSSRVVEVLLSRVPPSSLLGGKVAGIGLAGVAQFLAVVVTAAVTLVVTRPSGLPPGVFTALPMLVVWFVLGFAFYSLLYGSLGSLASRTEDAQAAASPVTALLVGIYVLAFVAVANPGSAWATVLSLLPPTAPILMPLRASLVSVPAWQVVAAVALMIAAIYGLFRTGARLYQNAVLHTGARLRLREAWRGEHAPPGPARS